MPALRKTGGARCWTGWPFLTLKLQFKRHRIDSEKSFLSKIAGAVFPTDKAIRTRIL